MMTFLIAAAISAGSFHVSVPAAANVFAAGTGGTRANGGGSSPIRVPLRGGKVVVITQARGRVSCCSGGNTFNDANGGTYFQTDILSSGGISGITAPVNMFLVGVFVGPRPPASAPARLDVSGMPRMSEVYPRLGQTFFVGDGRYVRPGAMGVRRMHAPPGAVALVLGFADSNGFHGPPGAYGDNAGSIDVRGRILNCNGAGCGSPAAGKAKAEPCYVNAGAYAAIAKPCFGPRNGTITIVAERPANLVFARLAFTANQQYSTVGIVTTRLSAFRNGLAQASVPPALCMGSFPHKWYVWLVDSTGRARGIIGDYSVTACP